MHSKVIESRLSGIQKALMGLYESGADVSTASRGREREHFISSFLEQVFPPCYRFGTGDAIDTFGARSGQLDVVIEFTFLPSLPTAIPGGPRIYLAEGVAAVLEVKSNLSSQWDEVVRTSSSLKELKRTFQVPGFTPYGPACAEIPLFAVGYRGWNKIESVREKANSGHVDGVLIIDEGLFSTREDYPNGLGVSGSPLSLWALVSCLHTATISIAVNSFSPIRYVATEPQT